MPDSDDVNHDDRDETLAENFKALMGKTSVGDLRKAMAAKGFTIGSGAVQSAKVGSRGLRLETLQKFADYFGVSVRDLLAPGGAADVMPLSSDVQRELGRLSARDLAFAENALRAHLRMDTVPIPPGEIAPTKAAHTPKEPKAA